MFGKPEPGAPAAAESGRTAPRPPSTTVVGTTARFVGDVSGEEDVTVAGRFEGKIHVGHDVKVAVGGNVDGEIAARSVFVGGTVRGQIVASDRAELASTAIVEGSVQAPKIIIAEGAQLEGNVAMTSGGGKTKSSKE